MTNKEVNQQNLNINSKKIVEEGLDLKPYFKLKLVKVKNPTKIDSKKLSRGLYEQLKTGNKIQYTKFDEKKLREVMEELFYGKNKK